MSPTVDCVWAKTPDAIKTITDKQRTKPTVKALLIVSSSQYFLDQAQMH
jgi:hypothetical protein